MLPFWVRFMVKDFSPFGGLKFLTCFWFGYSGRVALASTRLIILVLFLIVSFGGFYPMTLNRLEEEYCMTLRARLQVTLAEASHGIRLSR